MPTMVSVPVSGSPMDIYLDGPERDAPGPAIVLMYHRGGIDDFTKRVVGKLVGGWLPGRRTGCVASCRASTFRCRTARSSSRTPRWSRTFAPRAEYLRGRAGRATRSKLIIMGHCMGGRMVAARRWRWCTNSRERLSSMAAACTVLG